MNREQERAKRRPEKNPVVEYNKIQNKYYPELFAKFAEVNDPRNQSYMIFLSPNLQSLQVCRK